MNDTQRNGNDSNTEVRSSMKSYWGVYEPSLNSMLLSDDAIYLAENDQNEILSYLPPYKGTNVLELGAGIGRFTGKLALVAGEVSAVDFMDSYIKENEINNKELSNIKYICADVTELEFPSESFDLVFSNWLFMYLSNGEVQKLLEKILKWLKPNGHLFFRESCYHPSGNLPRLVDPSNYRVPLDYSKILFASTTEKYNFNVTSAKSAMTFVKAQGNPYQLCILAQKEPKGLKTNKFNESMKLLNAKEDLDSDNSESCFSIPLWNICGGEPFIKDLAVKLKFQPHQKLVCIGCGTGELPFYLANNFSTIVKATEDSILLFHKAIESQGKFPLAIKQKIQFEFTDILNFKAPMESFDHVLSLHPRDLLQNSSEIFTQAKKCLKPGGNLVLAVWVPQEKKITETSRDYSEDETLVNILKSNNFIPVEMKSDRNTAISWIKKVLESTQNFFNKEELKEKIELLKGYRLDWVTIIAKKNESASK